MKTNEVAKLTGITVRTLQYYDKIALLQPKKNQWNQYREYTKEDVEILQQILFFRELDFSLAEIKELMANPNYDKKEALARQKHLLTLKLDRLNRIIALVTETMNGGDSMKLLFAEDERSLSRAVVHILEKNCYSVDAVYDGEVNALSCVSRYVQPFSRCRVQICVRFD